MSSLDRRDLLRRLGRRARGGVVSVADAAEAWGCSSRDAALKLGRFARDGWVVRVRRGVYFVAPIEAGAHPVPEDPWMLAEQLFAPCYIGGWSAAEHWGLTEQLFRSTFVVTAAHIRDREPTLLGTAFHLTRAPASRIDSVKAIWHGRTRIRVSSPERTLVDALIAPASVGGVRHLAELLVAYRELPAASAVGLARELGLHGNGAAHKRAGWLAEKVWPAAAELLAEASRGRSAGVIRLDPQARHRGRMNRRWGLWVNVELDKVHK
jgi:predicted transcriptional regulator of viral defense system